MREAIILCGGQATRFRPYTNRIPKALVKINKKPIIDHQIEWLEKYGYNRIILAAGYKHKKLAKYVNKKYRNTKRREKRSFGGSS